MGRSTSQPWTENRLESYKEKKNLIVRQISEESLTNPTPAMVIQLKLMKTRTSALPSVHSVHRRRKGLVAKRRLGKGNQVSPEKALDGSFLDNKGDDSRISPEIVQHITKLPTEEVRKSPRLRRQDSRSLKDFVEMINPLKLVKSIFSNPEE